MLCSGFALTQLPITASNKIGREDGNLGAGVGNNISCVDGAVGSGGGTCKHTTKTSTCLHCHALATGSSCYAPCAMQAKGLQSKGLKVKQDEKEAVAVVGKGHVQTICYDGWTTWSQYEAPTCK